MSNRKKIIYILLISFLFLPSLVKAESQNIQLICSKGFLYYVKPDVDEYGNSPNISLSEYYTNDLDLAHTYSSDEKQDNWHTSKVNGKLFKYLSSGYYRNNGDSRNSNRCYAVQTTSTNKGGAETTTEVKYEPKICGESYKIEDLKITSEINKSNGLTTITITPKDMNSTIGKAFSRLELSHIDYKGVTNSGSGKGTATKNGNTIIISDIQPAKDDSDDHTYYIGFYINGIKEEDFSESGDVSKYISDCGGSNGGFYIGELTKVIKSENEIKVTNPIKNSDLCKKELANIPTGEAIKKGFVNECFDNEIIYSKLDNLSSSVKNKINTLNKIYSGATGVKGLASSKEVLSCTDNRLTIPSASSSTAEPFETKVTYEKVGNYFGMICIESYYVDGGIPSLVKSGMGIDYNNKVEVRKSCSIFQVGQASKPSKCSASFSLASCLHTTKSSSYTMENGGPSDIFDSCVKECDGGTYSQKCINSCYKKTYDDERINKITGNIFNENNIYYSNNKINTKKVVSQTGNIGVDTTSTVTWDGYTNGPISLGNGYTLDVNSSVYYGGNFNRYGSAIIRDSSGNIVFQNGYSKYCEDHSNPCTISISVGPSGCSNNPEQAYNSQVSAARTELQKLEAIAKEKSGIKEYSISFQDSKTYDIYKISGSSYDGNTSFGEPRLIIKDITDSDEMKESKFRNKGTTNYTIGDQGNTQTGITNLSFNTIYLIELPVTYSKVGDANKVLIQDNSNQDKYYTYNYGNTTKVDGNSIFKFTQYSVNKKDTLSDGAKSYYTNLFSDNYNVIVNSGKSVEMLEKIAHATIRYNEKDYTYELVNNYDNISVEFVIGANINDFDVVTNKDSEKVVLFDKSKLKCYYGVYSIDIPIPPPQPPVDESESNSSINTPPPTKNPDDNGTGNGGPYPEGGSEIANGLRYYYREIKLNDVFPNDRNPRWNWSGTVLSNGNVIGAANNSNKNYIVDPNKLVADIEKKGNSIYENENEIDYSYVLTPSLINEIRKYNRTKINGKKITYLDFSLEKNSINSNQSAMIKTWLPTLSTTKITDCNNALNGNCDNLEVKK